MVDSSKCPYYLNDFFTYQRVVKIRSEKTIEQYHIDLRLFLRYIKLTKGLVPKDFDFDKIEINDVPIELLSDFTKLQAMQYLNFLATKRNNSAKTRHRKTSSLRVFYSCLHKDLNLLTSNPIKDLDFPKMHSKLPKYLTLEESLRLLDNINPDDSDFLRNFCIITLFVNCGMRLSELVGMNFQDINFDERSIRLLGKGNKERIIQMNDACADALINYIAARPKSEIEPNAIFIGKQKRRLSNRRVEQIVEQALKDSNLDNLGYSVHKLRHTAATLMYQHGNVDTNVLKEILGHKSIATTEIYTHVSNERIKEAMDNSPLANVINKKKPK